MGGHRERPNVPRGRSSGAGSSAGRAAGRGAGLNLRSTILIGVLRDSKREHVASRVTCYGGWAASLRRRSGEGLRSATSRQGGRRCYRSFGGTARTSGSCCLACLTWAWARGVPASRRSWRPSHGAPPPMHIYARANGDGVGDALPHRSSSSWSSLPRVREMSLLLASRHEAVRAALCEHRRRGARGGVRGDLGR